MSCDDLEDILAEMELLSPPRTPTKTGGTMPYQIDVWSDDLHQTHAGRTQCDTWSEASEFMARMVDAGLLCNVLHTDFKAPPDKVAEMEAELVAKLSN